MNIETMIFNLDNFFFSEQSNCFNTIKLAHKDDLRIGRLTRSGTVLSVGFNNCEHVDAIITIAQCYCDLIHGSEIQPPECVDGNVKLDEREIHIVEDTSNKVVLIGYDDEQQGSNTIVKQLTSFDTDLEVSDSHHILPDGYYKFIYTPKRILFKGVKTRHDFKMFMKVLYLYMWYMISKSYGCANGTNCSNFVEINDCVIRKYISICVYFLSKYSNNLYRDTSKMIKDIVDNMSNFQVGIESEFVTYTSYEETIYGFVKLYNKLGDERFKEAMINGYLEVL